VLVACPAVIFTCILTVHLAMQHFRENPHDVLRACTVRILLLVPLYSVESFLQICVLRHRFVVVDAVRCIRKFYEAVVVFSFLQLVLVSAGGPDKIVELFPQNEAMSSDDEGDVVHEPALHDSGQEEDGAGDEVLVQRVSSAPAGAGGSRHDFAAWCSEPAGPGSSSPLVDPADRYLVQRRNCDVGPGSRFPAINELRRRQHRGAALFREQMQRHLRRSRLLGWLVPVWPSAPHMLRWCVFGPLLYVAVGIACALLGVLVTALELLMPESFGKGGSHERAAQSALKMGTGLVFLASVIANLSLHELTKNVKQEIRALKLTRKLLSIKLVVFVTFWQSLALQLMLWDGFRSRVQEDVGFDSIEQLRQALESVLLCFEMLATAAIHMRVWRTRDFQAVAAQLGRLHGETEDSDPQPLSRRRTLSNVMDLGFITRTVWDVELIHSSRLGLAMEDSNDDSDRDSSRHDTSCTSNTLGAADLNASADAGDERHRCLQV